jgi:acyl carrier protein
MHTFNTNVQRRILALVKAILEQNAMATEVDAESRLVDVGLTSMDMVNLMLGVEAEFDFTIPQWRNRYSQIAFRNRARPAWPVAGVYS